MKGKSHILEGERSRSSFKISFCSARKLKMELETFTVNLKVDTSMPAVEILGSETKLPLVFYKVSISFRDYHLVVSLTNAVASPLSLLIRLFCGSIGGGAGGGGRGRGVGAGAGWGDKGG